MTKKILQKLRGQVVAFLPIYDEEGRNRTLLCLRDGSELRLNAALNSVLRNYLALWALDRMRLQELYACPNQSCPIAPLAITGRHTLLPLRARRSLRRRDGAYAWLEYESLNLEELRPGAQGLELDCGGHRLEMRVSRQHLLQMIHWAAWAREHRHRMENGQGKTE